MKRIQRSKVRFYTSFEFEKHRDAAHLQVEDVILKHLSPIIDTVFPVLSAVSNHLDARADTEQLR